MPQYKEMIGKTIKDVSDDGVEHGGFRLFFEDGSDVRFDFPEISGKRCLVVFCGKDYLISANAELCQPCPPSTPPRQETADGQGLA